MAVPVYEIGGRDGGYTVIFDHLIIGHNDGVFDAHIDGESSHLFRAPLVQAHPDDFQAPFAISLMQIVEVGYGQSAWGTPCCPEIEQDYLPPQLGEGYGFSIDGRQGEIRGQRPLLLGGLFFAAYGGLD